MFKPHTVLTIGLWLIAISFLGIASSWKIWLYSATGVGLVVAYLYHLGRETILKLAKEQSDDTVSSTKDSRPIVSDGINKNPNV